MKGLTLTQPWATLVAIGAKGIETRSWGTNYRGQVAIHAAKKHAALGDLILMQEPFRSLLAAHRVLAMSDLPCGAIVAVARLANVLPIADYRTLPAGQDCIALDEEGVARVWTAGKIFGYQGHDGAPQWKEHESAFGDYTPGRFDWLLEDVQALAEPIPCRGALSLWQLPADVQSLLNAQTAGAS